MISINYPEPEFRMKNEADKELIFDSIRKKWIVLTPEEWVRQNFVQYLVQVKNYPAALIALEKEIQLGELTKRFDVLVYDANHVPWMMIECKAMNVRIDETVLEQLARYNAAVPVTYLIITNGKLCFGYSRRNGTLHGINELPEFGT